MESLFFRPVRGLLHGILLISSLAVLGLSARSCAELVCTPKQAFLVAAGILSTLLTIILCISLAFVSTFPSAITEAILSVFLLLWWSAAAGVATAYSEQPSSQRGSLLVGFAWLALIIAFITAYVALIFAFKTCAKRALERDLVQNDTRSLQPNALQSEEVPESVLMNDQPVGDLAWKTPNLA